MNISESHIGLILALYAVNMVAQSFFLAWLQAKMGNRAVYLMSVFLGILNCAFCIILGSLSKTLFVICAVMSRIAAGC
jgi:MFS family permease